MRQQARRRDRSSPFRRLVGDVVLLEFLCGPLACVSVAGNLADAVLIQDAANSSTTPAGANGALRSRTRSTMTLLPSRCPIATVKLSPTPPLGSTERPIADPESGGRMSIPREMQRSTSASEMKLSMSTRNSAPYSALADAGSRSIASSMTASERSSSCSGSALARPVARRPCRTIAKCVIQCAALRVRRAGAKQQRVWDRAHARADGGDDLGVGIGMRVRLSARTQVRQAAQQSTCSRGRP